MSSAPRLNGNFAPGRLSVDAARALLDFRGGGTSPISEHAAEEQLEGAVAIHNILHEEGFAYLADEVGMGKTYVALGALALFRHFKPDFRVLVIAPRENIQKKWLKELKNFAARNVRFPDLRVRAMHGAPARATVLCNSLVELVRETAVDPDRDFFTRLTSFSLPLGDSRSTSWSAKRDQLLEHLPWLDSRLFDLRNKDAFKDNFARAINCGLPVFDLVIFDEGHNIKGGRHHGAARNRALALAFGHPAELASCDSRLRGYRAKAKRVLFLSATPLENDYIQLWNQLDIFGFGAMSSVLEDADATDEEKRACARRFLVRRVTTLPVAGEKLTKNLYRREWRNGGVAAHDEPLPIPGEMQRLTVALVQKKVSEVLGSAKFNNCFQIGMLASFESFLETAQVQSKAGSDERNGAVSNFDDPDQSDRVDERLGIDVGSVNHLARSYRKQFGRELPHPKMDATVDELESAFTTGGKALVFVRRVASVKELQRKLEERYDAYLFRRLSEEVKAELQQSIQKVVSQYQLERAEELRPRGGASATDTQPAPRDGWVDGSAIAEPHAEDEGGTETFFAWFFRGEGPKGRVLSGATLQKRFSQGGSVHSTFFWDNHVAYVMGVPPSEVTVALASYLGRPRDALARELEHLARPYLPRVKKQQRRNLFLAFQRAAIELLAEHPGSLRERATIVREERYADGSLSTVGASTPPALEGWLEIGTFWTALRARPELRNELWPEPTVSDFRQAFREAELRRELLSAMARLGNPFIDLYVLSVNRLDRLELRAREQEDLEASDLAREFLDLLERQRADASGHTSFSELHDAAQNFDLILAVNEPHVRGERLANSATLFGRLLRSQQPVGGMFGQVNETLIRQFRMPGYPRILITTDLLQEGEDLHTFCSKVYHYGISWMPSSMEQRAGRVDRVSSHTDRRLTRSQVAPKPEQLLQVYYPHLKETVEVLQVRRVVERLNRFMRLMHEELGSGETEERVVNVSNEILRDNHDIAPIREPLRTAFPIKPHMLAGHDRPLAVSPGTIEALRSRFRALRGQTLVDHAVEWDERADDAILFGTFQLRTRRQPFVLLLRSVNGRAAVRCVSPVGVVGDVSGFGERVRMAARHCGVRVGAVFNQDLETYDLTVEGDVLLGEASSDRPRVSWLLRQVAEVADRLEEMLLGMDQPLRKFQKDLEQEVSYER